jgi:hypothetical protein
LSPLSLGFASALGCLAVHAVIERRFGGFSDAFKVGRSVVSLVLATLGFFAMWHWRGASSATWVLETPEALATALAGIPIGHFVADLGLIAWGRLRHGEAVRSDLVAHHLLGLVAGTLTMLLPIAAPLYLVLYTSELMPVTTGWVALAERAGSAGWAHRGQVARAVVIALLRVPLWVVVGVGAGVGFAAADETGPRVVYGCSALFSLLTTSLDVHWFGACVRGLRRGAARRGSRAA